MPIPISFDFAGVPEDFGFFPPEGPYAVEIASAKLTDDGRAVGYGLKVLSGENAGQTINSYLNLALPGDEKARAKAIAWKRWLIGFGLPKVNLEGPLSFDAEQLVGAQGVVYVRHREWEGKQKHDEVPVPPEDRQAALTGQWTPGGGKAPVAGAGGAAGAAGVPGASGPLAQMLTGQAVQQAPAPALAPAMSVPTQAPAMSMLTQAQPAPVAQPTPGDGTPVNPLAAMFNR